MSDLFRKEVMDHATQRLQGEVVLAMPLATRLLGLLAIGVVLAVAVFVSTATYARKEMVSGWLTPERGVVRAAALTGGQLETLLVAEGDIVRAGDTIARLRLDAQTAGGGAGEQILESLQSQSEAAARGAEAEIARLQSDAARLRASIAGLEEEAAGLLTEISLQRERVSLADDQVARAEQLVDRGFMSGREFDDRQSQALQARQTLAGLERNRTTLARQIADARGELEAIPLRIEAERARAEAARASLEERTRSAQARTHLLITAPIDARVAALPVRAGAMVSAGEAVAVLIPQGDRLVAELYTPSRAAGFIAPGQEVRLMYQAFPHQRFGAGRGTITAVSTTVLAPTEISIPGLQLNEPVFRVVAELDQESVNAYGEAIPLQPGMMLSADIIVDRRTLIEFLFDPLFAAGRRG